MTIEVLILCVSLLASAFFAGMEIAFVSSDKLLLELDKSKNKVQEKILTQFIHNPSKYVSAMLLGNILALVVFAISFNYIFNSYQIESDNPMSVLLIEVIALTLIILITTEFLPKTFFSSNPNLALNLLSIPAALFFILLKPLTTASIALVKSLYTSFFNTEIGAKQEQMIFGKIDLNNFTSEVESEGGETQHEIDNEIKLFKNALDFSKVRVRDCMVQRPDIEIMEENSPIDQLRQKFIETGYSKILIYRDHIDNIVGYVHSYDLFNQPGKIEYCLRDVSFIPETMEAKKLLSILFREHKSIAVVVDEFGGTAGIVTTEDILEEIFGEIEDEHDKPGTISKKISEKHYVFSGRLEIESINEIYNLNLPPDNSYDTIAGYILYHHSTFPKTNTIINIDKYEFRILRSSKTSIELVEMKITE